jgi:hypothetical protein
VIEPEPEAEPEAAFSREPEPETHAPILTAKKKKVVRKVVKKPSSEAAAEEPAAEGVSEAPSEEAATEPGIKTYDTSEGGDTGETSADKHDGEAKKEDDWKSDLGAEAAAAVDEESEADEEPVGKPKWKKVKVDATPEAKRNRIIVYATSIGMVTALTVTTMVIPSFRFRDEMSVLRSSQVGDIVSYGKYKGNTDWIVLDKQPDRVLCISDFEVGDTRDDEIFWETSPVREELNSTFMNSTFNLYERIRILSADTIRQQDPEYTTAYVTKDMDDKVFILKDSELKNYISDNSDRMVQLSDMAVHPAMWVDIK